MPGFEEGAILRGRYRIVRPIGEGGMGTVYEAVHERLGSRVVVKTITSTLENADEFRARFELEARAAARLTSPHVVKVFDVDVAEDGTMYMVMEHLEGTTLSGLATGEPLSVEDACTFVLHVCAALEEAHHAGLVHRDIKPSNIFVVGGGRDRFAKLLDFGIAKVMKPAGGSADDLKTASGTILGTPRFMAPEQVRGNEVDGRADIWSLGVVLYTLLSRKFPFKETSVQSLFAAILLDAPTPIQELVPDLPPALARAVMRALERDPAARHPDARAFGDSLLPFARGSEPFRAVAAKVAPSPSSPGSDDVVSRTVTVQQPPTPSGVAGPERTERMRVQDRTPSAALDAVSRNESPASVESARSSRAPWIIAGVMALAIAVASAAAVSAMRRAPAVPVPLVSAPPVSAEPATSVAVSPGPAPSAAPVVEPSPSASADGSRASAPRPSPSAAAPRGAGARTVPRPSAAPSASSPAIPPIL